MGVPKRHYYREWALYLAWMQEHTGTHHPVPKYIAGYFLSENIHSRLLLSPEHVPCARLSELPVTKTERILAFMVLTITSGRPCYCTNRNEASLHECDVHWWVQPVHCENTEQADLQGWGTGALCTDQDKFYNVNENQAPIKISNLFCSVNNQCWASLDSSLQISKPYSKDAE